MNRKLSGPCQAQSSQSCSGSHTPRGNRGKLHLQVGGAVKKKQSHVGIPSVCVKSFQGSIPASGLEEKAEMIPCSPGAKGIPPFGRQKTLMLKTSAFHKIRPNANG